MMKQWILSLLLLVNMVLSICFPFNAVRVVLRKKTNSSWLLLTLSRGYHRRAPISSLCRRTARMQAHRGDETVRESKRHESATVDQLYNPCLPYFPIFFNDIYEVKLPKNHRFPMEKYRTVRELAQKWIGEQSQEEKNRVSCEFRVSPLATIEELTTTHSQEYVDGFLRGDLSEEEIRNVGFPWSESGVKRSLSSVGGTVAAAVSVCEALCQQRKEEHKTLPLWSAHVAGGTHHAFFDRGEGFCVFSDIAVAANVIRQRYRDLIRRVLIIDLDVHQGNGNAVLFQGRPDVSTFSMHCSANYFSPKEESDLDVELPVGCSDETYLVTLKHWLTRIDEIGGSYDLIFFQAGVDVLEEDRLGRMSLTSDGVMKRNKLVFDFVKGKQLPLVITMGGGYPRTGEDWSPILEAHANVYYQAHRYLGRGSD